MNDTASMTQTASLDLTDGELAMRFESLGGTGHGCEFGLFQRHYGVEPLGLLRWADLAHELLIHALEARFEGVGAPENTLVFTPPGADEWWTKDARYWMAMRSFVKVADLDLEGMTRQVCARLQFLTRKLIEDLQSGAKIFVYRNMFKNLTEQEVQRLHGAIRAYGDATLLYVRFADDAHPNGSVEATAPGLLVGYIDNFAFSPEDKPIGPANETWLGICRNAWRIYCGAAAETPRLPAPAAGARAKRRVALVGNCQAQAMAQLYRNFVAARTGEIVDYVPSYHDVTQEGHAALEQADVIVEQLFDLKQQAETAGVAASTPRLYIPMVTGAFLWPFSGQAHPKNQGFPWLTGGPYGGDASDSWLNRQIVAGVSTTKAVKAYMKLDVMERVNLDRMYELIMDRQRSRDDASDYNIADLIEQHFRTEQAFLSPYHPNLRIALGIATRLFQQLGAEQRDIDLLHARMRVTPFPKGELPIHPSVASHFGLTYIVPNRRYRFMNEGSFTFQQYATRYMKYKWNEALEEGMSLAHAGKAEPARDKLLAGVLRSPNSAAGYNALNHVFVQLDQMDDAVAAARQAVRIDPDAAPYHAALGNLLRRRGQMQEAEAELRAALAADPSDPHFYVLLAHFCRQREAMPEAVSLIRQALALDPYSTRLYAELAEFTAAAGDPTGAIQVLRDALALIPNAPVLHVALSEQLLRQGQADAAMTEAQAAAAIEPAHARAFGHLAHLLVRRGDPRSAETALRRAIELEPTNNALKQALAGVLDRLTGEADPPAAAGRTTELEPADPRHHADLAQQLAAAGNLTGAEAALREAVNLAPSAFLYRLQLSDNLLRQGRRPEGLVEAQIAFDLAPESAHAMGHLAHALQMNDQFELALPMYENAVSLAPDNDHLRRQLANTRERWTQAEAA